MFKKTFIITLVLISVIFGTAAFFLNTITFNNVFKKVLITQLYYRLGIKVDLESIKLKYFLPSIIIENLNLESSDLDVNYTIKAESLKIKFSILRLISGKLYFSDFVVTKPTIVFNKISKEEKFENINNFDEETFKNIFSKIIDVRIDKFSFIDGDYSYKDGKNDFDIKNASITIKKDFSDNLFLYLDAAALKVANLSFDKVSTNIEIEPELITLNSLVLKSGENDLFFRADLKKLKNFTVFSQNKVSSKYLFETLKKLKIIENEFDLESELEIGSLLEGEFLENKMTFSKIEADLNFINLQIKKQNINVPNLFVKLNKEADFLILKEIKLFDNEHYVNFNDVKISLSDYSIIGTGVIDSVEFSHFLTMFDITGCLSYFNINGPFSFSGTVYPKFEVLGLFNLDIDDFWLVDQRGIERISDNSLFNFPKAKLYGFVSFNEKRVNFDNVKVYDGKSDIYVSGDINYSDSKIVDLDIYSDKLNLASISRLKKIAIKGSAQTKLNLTVTNDLVPKTLIVGTVDVFDLSLDDFYFGTVSMKVAFKDSVLAFDDTLIAVNYSDINSVLKFYFNENEDVYFVLNASSEKLYLEDLYTILNYKELPKHSPLGVVNTKFYLKYFLKTGLYDTIINVTAHDLSLLDENISSLNFILNAKDKKIKDSILYLKKGNSYLTVKLYGDLDNLEFKVTNNNINLKDFYFFKSKDLNVNTSINTKGTVKFINKKVFSNLAFNIDDYFIGKTNYGKSKISLNINDTDFLLDFKLFNDSFSGDLKYSDNIYFKGSFSKFNFYPFLNLYRKKDSDELSFIDGKLEFIYDIKNKILSSVKVSDGIFNIINEDLKIRSDRLINFEINKTIVSFGRFSIVSQYAGTDCRLDFSEIKGDKIIKGCLSAGVLSLFSFVNGVNGSIIMNLKLNDSSSSNSLDGYMSTSDVAVGIRDVSSFTLDGKYIFKNSLVTFEAVSLESLNGIIKIDGNIDLKNLINLKSAYPKINLSSEFKNFSLSYPKGLNGFWDGLLKISGSKIPYLIEGNLFFNNGSFRNEFDTVLLPKKVSLLEEYDPYLLFNISLKTKNDLLINNDLFEGTLVFDLKLLGSESDIKAEGKVNIVNGQIFYNDNIFTVNSGKIILNDDGLNTYQIDSETKISNYQVFLQVSGTGGEYVINIYSVPSLSETELVSLLTTGELINEYTKDNPEFSFSFGQGSLTDKFSITKGLKDEAGIKINLKYNKDSKSSMPSIQLEKKLTNDLKLKFEKSLDESINKQGINVQYDLNKNAKIRLLLEEDRSYENKNDPTKAGFDFRFKFDF